MQASYKMSLFSGFEEQLKCILIQQIFFKLSEMTNIRVDWKEKLQNWNLCCIYTYLQLLLNKMHSGVVKM